MRLMIATLAFASLALAAPTFAQDAAAGTKVFKKCQSCHSVVDPDGKVLAGTGNKAGPNLYAVIGRVAGSYPDFKYGAGIEELMTKGFVWTDADIALYAQDPTKFLQEKTGDPKAKSNMAFKLPKADEAANVVAYLASLSPPAPAATAPAPAVSK